MISIVISIVRSFLYGYLSEFEFYFLNKGFIVIITIIIIIIIITIIIIRIKRDFLKHKTIKVRDNKLNRRFGVDITPLSR